MDLRKISSQIEAKLSEIFSEDLISGLPAREDSRAFGSMVEEKIADNWKQICEDIGLSPLERPGKRSIYDFALQSNDKIIGLDVKTKDLDSVRYSDGGICSVRNILEFLSQDGEMLLIAELGHNKLSNQNDKRNIVYFRVVPFTLLPCNMYRLENLGTGQVRFNHTIDEIWDKIDWDRDISEFYDMFIDLAIQHHKRVGSKTLSRIAALEEFKESGYKDLSLK